MVKMGRVVMYVVLAWSLLQVGFGNDAQQYVGLKCAVGALAVLVAVD